MPVEDGVMLDSPPETISATPAETPAVATPNSQDTTAPESSTGKDESVLDRVKAALAPKTDGSSPSQAGKDPSPNPEASPESDDEEPEGDPTAEELERYHSKTRKRINKLVTERNQARDEAEQLRPDAEVGRRITGFLSDAKISGEEANLLLDIGRNMRSAPLKALEQIKPFYDTLQRMAGEILPTDLQEAVSKGEITETYARQLARGRTETSVLSQRTQANDEANRQRQEADQRQQHGAAVGQAISTWESNQAKSDPDWNLKQGRIGELIELDIRRNGYPKTAQAAVDLAEKAKTQVTAEYARFRPRPQAVNTVNPASAARVAPAKPTSALEAARLALGNAG